MGACYNSLQFRSLNKRKVLREWRAAVDDSQYEDGHSYSGCVGMLTGDPVWETSKVFHSRESANEYISNKHQKCEPPIAVRCLREDGSEGWLIGGWCSS